MKSRKMLVRLLLFGQFFFYCFLGKQFCEGSLYTGLPLPSHPGAASLSLTLPSLPLSLFYPFTVLLPLHRLPNPSLPPLYVTFPPLS